MATPDELQDATDDAALGPAEVRVGNETVRQQPIPDLIALEQHRSASQGVARPGFGLRFQKIKPFYQ